MVKQSQAASPRRLKVFLCHASEDKPAVRDLHKRLEGCNVDSWLDEENILPGQNWEYEIRKAVRNADVVIPDGYTVRISAEYDPEAKPWIVDTGWAPTDYTYTFSAGGTYYWHIRACKPCTPFHPGNWAIRSFIIHT